MTTPSYAAKLRGGAGGGGSRFFSDSRPPVQDPPSTMFPLCLKTLFSLTYASSSHQWTKLREMIFFSKIFKFLWMKSPTSGQSQSPNYCAWFSSQQSNINVT